MKNPRRFPSAMDIPSEGRNEIVWRIITRIIATVECERKQRFGDIRNIGFATSSSRGEVLDDRRGLGALFRPRHQETQHYLDESLSLRRLASGTRDGFILIPFTFPYPFD